MSNLVRAWKDEVYRQSLSVEEQAVLPANPAGEIELTEAELEALFGAGSGFGWSPHPSSNVDNTEVDRKAQTTFGGQQLNFSPSSVLTVYMPITTQSVGSGSCNIGQQGNASIWDGD